MKNFFLIIMTFIITLGMELSLSCVCQADMVLSDYPFVNQYEATVVGTPRIYMRPMPEKKVRSKELKLTIFEDRVIPKVFWYHDKLKCSVAYLTKEAPLIFIIAGTGSAYNSSKMKLLQKVFFHEGFHSVAISSPTHPNFIVTASKTGIPGYIVDDAEDIYRVMEIIRQKIKKRVKVSEFYLTGYSLGAAQSAFIAKLDETKRSFDFKKVLMINPPVSLFTSVTILDEMLVENIPGGTDNLTEFFEKTMDDFSQLYNTLDFIDFNDDFLYKIYMKSLPTESFLAALIGLSFRMSSTNMVFTSDVMSNAGLVVPENRVLSTTESLTDYFKVTMNISFVKYFDELLFPYFKSKNSRITRQALIDSLSLESIESYLASADKISVVTNDDDLILGPGEINFFRKVFKKRARIYANGGHCGNMVHSDFIGYIIDYFKNRGNI